MEALTNSLAIAVHCTRCDPDPERDHFSKVAALVTVIAWEMAKLEPNDSRGRLIDDLPKEVREWMTQNERAWGQRVPGSQSAHLDGRQQ